MNLYFAPISKSVYFQPTVFDISFESVEARLAHGQLHVSEIDSAVNLYKLRQNMDRPLPPVRLNSIARPAFDQSSPVILARPPPSPTSSNSSGFLSQPWLLLVSATLAVLLMTCLSCVLFYWQKQKKRDRTTSESPVLASSQPPQVSNNHKRRPPPVHSGINDQKVHRFRS